MKRWLLLLTTFWLAFVLASCATGGDSIDEAIKPSADGGLGDGTTDVETATFVVGGTATGLLGTGLVLQNAGGDDLSLAADGTFTFATKLATGAAYDVTIKTQPSAPKQTCTVTGGKGVVAAANVTTVVVSCLADAFTIGGTVSGLVGTGLVLGLDGGETVAITANGTFAFPTPRPSGTTYKVTVLSQPTAPSQVCVASSNEGTVASAPVVNVAIACTTTSFAVGGTITGLAGSGLVLQDNGGDDLPVSADGAFVFPTKVASGAAYAVTIKTPPSVPAQTCVVTNGSGTVGASDVTNVTIACSTLTFKVKGSVSGLAGTGMILTNNGGDDLPISADGAFAFATPIASGGAYAVAIKAQPGAPAQTCTVSGATGSVVASDVASVVVNCANDSFTIGGVVVGLSGSGLVLTSNASDDLAVGANGSFAFAKPVTAASFYNVTIKTQPVGPAQTCIVVGGVGTVSSGNVTTVVVNCSSTLVVIGGTVSGLEGRGLVLANNGGDDARITGNGTFGFATPLAKDASFVVSVKTQPTSPSQTCTVTNGSGTATGSAVTNVAISCVTNRFTVSGVVSGLTGGGLVLQNGGAGDLAITGNGPFTFAGDQKSGTSYQVTVKTSPSAPTQTCTVASGSGIVGASPVSDVKVQCSIDAFTVGGSVTGLVGSGLVLVNNGEELAISGVGAFSFATKVASGGAYLVTVKTPPSSPAQSCVVTNGSGSVAGADVTGVSVVCSTNKYTVGGTVTGLVGTGLVLQNGLADDLPISGNGPFAFATTMVSGASYSVTIKTQPSAPTQTCSVTGASGGVGSGAVTSVVVNCATDKFTVSGTVAGLEGSGLRLLLSGAAPVEVTGNGAFAFSTAIASGSMYVVTVDAHPTSKSQTCSVTNGTGTVAGANVTNVQVQCVTNSYPVAVNVSGLAGSGLVVQNGPEKLSITGNGERSFVTLVASGATYDVSVSTQPSTPAQTCSVVGSIGTVGGAKVVVDVVCVTNSYTVSGNVTGLASGGSLVLRNQAGVDVQVTGTGSAVPFSFATNVTSGASWSVVVQARPTAPISQTCTVTNGAGTMGGANVTNVAVSCTTNTYTVLARVIGMTTGTLVVQNNGGSDVSFTGNGTLPFAPKLSSGATYGVTIKTQPSANQTCTVSSGTGVIGDGDVTVTVNCATTYTVGGSVTGLAGGSVVLVNNGGDDVTITGNGTYNFTFGTPLVSGATYVVTPKTQPGSPKWQTCTVANGSGTIGTVNVSNVTVSCVTNTYSVGGTVTGLSSGSLVLRNNGGDTLTLTTASLGAGGAFAFPIKIASGSTYAVTVYQDPATPGLGQTCTATAATGTVQGANVTTVQVACVTNYSVGGTVGNLYGDGMVLELKVNGAAWDTITRNYPSTSFTFAKPVPAGRSYAVTVLTQPTRFYQVCTVASGTGTMPTSNVGNVAVSCGAVTKIEITQTFQGSGAPVAIPDNPTNDCNLDNAATPLTNEIVLTDNHFTVGNVTVKLNGLQHTWVGDLKARLERDIGSGTSNITASTSLFSRPGRYTDTPGCGSSGDFGGAYTFDDVGASTVWTSTAANATYHPVGPRANSTVTGYTYLESAAPNGFAGSLLYGKWRVVITDHNAGDTGTITSWTLTLTP